MPGADASVLRLTVVLEYTFRVWSGFRQVTCAIGGVTRGAWLARRCIGGDDTVAEQSLFTLSKRGRS